MGLRQIAAVLVVGTLSAVGCYSPNITSGGFACGTDGGCPDNFHCYAPNHRCYQETNPNVDMLPACASDASVPQVCTAPHVSGQVCNPGCQTGCTCGWCGVANGATKCLTEKPGTKNVGALCTPSSDSDCMPGLYCQPECNTGRCYRICDSSDKSVCGTGSTCSVNANSRGDAGTFSFTLCSLVAPCDAVSQTGCSGPFACYPTGLTPPAECDCPGTVATGQQCIYRAQCVRGDSCVGPAGMSSLCLQTCVSNADCTAGTCMNPANTAYGYCMM